MDLLGYFDIQDFLRITPSWALPALGSFLLNEWSSYVRGTNKAAKVDKTPVAKKSLWRTIWQVLVDPDEGIYQLSLILSAWLFVRFFRHQDYWAILLLASNAYMIWRPAIWYVRRVQKSNPRQRFVFGFIPIRALPSLVFLLAISFGYGLYMEPLILRWAPLATVELKQNNSIVEGKVIVQLSRYVVLRRSDKSIVAIESSNILKISRPEDERSIFHHVKPTQKSSCFSGIRRLRVQQILCQPLSQRHDRQRCCKATFIGTTPHQLNTSANHLRQTNLRFQRAGPLRLGGANKLRTSRPQSAREDHI